MWKKTAEDMTTETVPVAGLTEADIELDIGRLKTITTAMLSQMGLNTAPQGIDEHIHEV